MQHSKTTFLLVLALALRVELALAFPLGLAFFFLALLLLVLKPVVLVTFLLGQISLTLAVLELLARHDVCEEAVARLDLAKNDIIEAHFVS